MTPSDDKQLQSGRPEEAKRPNRLIVDQSNSDDKGFAFLNGETIMNLGVGIDVGNRSIIRSKLGKETICKLEIDSNCPGNKILLSREARNNLNVRIADIVSVYPTEQLPDAKCVTLQPIADTVQGMTGNLKDVYITSYFRKMSVPLVVGNTVAISAAMRTVEFKVMKLEPNQPCVVGDDTLKKIGEPIKRGKGEGNMNFIGYDDLGGVKKELVLIRKLVEFPLRHPSFVQSTGIKPPCGILLYGPPGVGKSLIARAVSNETGVHFHVLSGPEIMAKTAGESEASLRRAFSECVKHSPAILFIDEIDYIAPHREKTSQEMDRRVVCQLLALVDEYKSQSNIVIVIGATDHPNSVDPAIRRLGRFTREINIGIPDEEGRHEILKIHTKKMKLADDIDLKKIASQCHGYVGADIASLCSGATLQQIRNKMDVFEAETTDVEVLDSFVVAKGDFDQALIDLKEQKGFGPQDGGLHD